MGDAAMASTRVFESNRSQAVRIAKAVEFPPDVRDVSVRRIGRIRIISPANALWDDFFEAAGVDLGERQKPAAQERESF